MQIFYIANRKMCLGKKIFTNTMLVFALLPTNFRLKTFHVTTYHKKFKENVNLT